MINTSDSRAREKAERETEAKAKRRDEQARIVKGLQGALDADEQIFGFSRGLVAGGLRGKLTVGFEALFAPYVNIGLTERRVILQHIQPLNGEPSEILPHSFPIAEIAAVTYSAIETFGAEPAGRLTLRLTNDHHFRLRVHDTENTQNARKIAEVFSSLVSARPKSRTSPTQTVCPHCDRILDRLSKFCPYCGQTLQFETAVADPEPEAEMQPESYADQQTVILVSEPLNVFDESVIETASENTIETDTELIFDGSITEAIGETDHSAEPEFEREIRWQDRDAVDSEASQTDETEAGAEPDGSHPGEPSAADNAGDVPAHPTPLHEGQTEDAPPDGPATFGSIPPHGDF